MKFNVKIKIINDTIFDADILLLSKDLIIKSKIDKDNIEKFIEETYSIGNYKILKDRIEKNPFNNLTELIEKIKETFPNLTYEKTK